MDRKTLIEQILKKKSFLCVGLDTDLKRIPEHLLDEKDPIFSFNKSIIDNTRDLCVAYKPNTAFYEAAGAQGWNALRKTIDYIGDKHLIIADAKRGDIGNTSGLYARAFFEDLGADAITVAPYMGEDSVKPFLNYKEKWVILLVLTSNSGSGDFQLQSLGSEKLYEKVLRTSREWASEDQIMYVVGATHPTDFRHIRKIAPDNFLLVPGIGTQGGNLQKVCQHGMNAQVGLLVNASRSIIYAGSGTDFGEKARQVAANLQVQMAEIIKKNPNLSH